jgi:hypothetical protein
MNIKSSPLKLRFNKEVNERGSRIGGERKIFFLVSCQEKENKKEKGRKVTSFFSDSLSSHQYDSVADIRFCIQIKKTDNPYYYYFYYLLLN